MVSRWAQCALGIGPKAHQNADKHQCLFFVMVRSRIIPQYSDINDLSKNCRHLCPIDKIEEFGGPPKPLPLRYLAIVAEDRTGVTAYRG